MTVFGLSKHSLVTNGSLTLPNGDVVSYPQPSNGDCALIKFDDTPPVNLSSNAASVLAEQGRELRDYALMSGDGIAGVSIPDSFIYKSPNGKRWRVDVSGLIIQSNAVSGNVVFTQFGQFQKDPPSEVAPTFNVAVNLADAGQSTPAIVENGETMNPTVFELQSFAPNGKECTLVIKGQFFGSPQNAYEQTPIGFISLAISGDENGFVVAPSVYKNRAETIGIFTASSVDNTTPDEWSMYSLDPNGASWTQDPYNNNLHDLHVILSVGTFTYTDNFDNRILSVVYDELSNKIPVVFSYSYQKISAYTAGSASGVVLSANSSSTADFSIKITIGAVVLEMLSSGTSDVPFDYTYISPASGTVRNTTQTISTTVNGDINNAVFQNTTGALPVSGTYGSATTESLTGAGFGVVNHLYDHTKMVTTSTATEVSSDILYNEIRFYELTKYLFGFKAKKEANGGAITYHRYNAINAAGKSSGIAINDGVTEDTTSHATHNPKTGEIVINSAEPVCFV